MRQTSDVGIAKIKQWEGFKKKAYRDGGGVWTVGYGHTSDENLTVTSTTHGACPGSAQPWSVYVAAVASPKLNSQRRRESPGSG